MKVSENAPSKLTDVLNVLTANGSVRLIVDDLQVRRNATKVTVSVGSINIEFEVDGAPDDLRKGDTLIYDRDLREFSIDPENRPPV